MTYTEQFLPLRVVVFLPNRGQLIGVLGLIEAFDAANKVAQHKEKAPLYEIDVVSAGDAVESAAGLVVQTKPADEIQTVHTLVVGGRLEDGQAPPEPEAVAAVARLETLSSRTVGICAGTFLLGEIGALDGRRCTTHWLLLRALAQRFPNAQVESDALFVEDGIYTSAGATAGIDLALHLIAHDGGDRLALEVARCLVVFARRTGGQSQFGSSLRLNPGLDERLRGLVNSIVQHPAGDHRVPELAARVGMSPRHFARVFREKTGETPATFVSRTRVEAAQRALSRTDAGMASIASACGFGTEATLRRTFARVCGISPSTYRERF